MKFYLYSNIILWLNDKSVQLASIDNVEEDG